MTANRARAKRGTLLLLCTLLPAAATAPATLGAQSVLTRTPNLSGGWVGDPGAVHFNFVHRFHLVRGEIVVNTPSFLLAAPLPASTLLGVQYASNSLVAGFEQNELEVLGRWAPLSGVERAPLDVALTAAYNEASGSADGELSVTLPVGPLRILGVGRAFSDAFGQGEAGFAGGGGLSLRVTDGISVAGDAVVASDRSARQAPAWSAGVQMRVPLTPHSLSIQIANSRTATLQGSSVGQQDAGSGDDQTFWGFEFTIPFTFSRYFGGDGGGGTATEAAPAGAGDRMTVTMTDGLGYAPSVIRIQAGETVVWRNTTDLVHTITADPERAARSESVSLPDGVRTFHSGNLRPGESFAYTFEEPGEYVYFCVPHELAGMVGRVVVTR